MNLDVVILILYFNGYNESYVFCTKEKYKKFIDNNLNTFNEKGLKKWELYYAKLASKG